MAVVMEIDGNGDGGGDDDGDVAGGVDCDGAGDDDCVGARDVDCESREAALIQLDRYNRTIEKYCLLYPISTALLSSCYTSRL